MNDETREAIASLDSRIEDLREGLLETKRQLSVVVDLLLYACATLQDVDRNDDRSSDLWLKTLDFKRDF